LFTDSAAELFTEVPGSPGFVIVAVMFNNVGGVTSVTFTATGSSSVILGVAEYSGVIALDTVNQADSGQVPISATYTSGSLATSGSEDLLVGFINNYTTEAVTLIPDSPFSVRAERSDAGFGWRASILDSLSSPAGTYANSGSFSSGSNTYDAVFIPFLTTPSVITGFASEEANYGIIITG
jgi:hypothetical protein